MSDERPLAVSLSLESHSKAPVKLPAWPWAVDGADAGQLHRETEGIDAYAATETADDCRSGSRRAAAGSGPDPPGVREHIHVGWEHAVIDLTRSDAPERNADLEVPDEQPAAEQ